MHYYREKKNWKQTRIKLKTKYYPIDHNHYNFLLCDWCISCLVFSNYSEE